MTYNNDKNINDISVFFKNILSSENNRPAVGLFCTYAPEELIFAAGFVPSRVMGRKKLARSESYFPINFCPYIKSSWESLLSADGSLKAAVFTNSCDGMRRLYDTANIYLKNTPSYLLDVPRLQGESSINFFKGNLNDMKIFMGDLAGRKITDGEIEKTAAVINKKRKTLKKFSRIFKELPHLILISTYFKVMELSMTSDPLIFTDELEKYIEFIEKTSRDHKIIPGKDNKKIPSIMIIGNFITENKLWDMLSALNLKLAADDLCTSTRYFEKQIEINSGQDILYSMAQRYLTKPPCMRMADLGLKLKEIENNITENNIEGVIFISLKFCDTVLYSFPLLKQKLNQLKIPVLYLEMEYNNFSEGQLKTRIQAFLEML